MKEIYGKKERVIEISVKTEWSMFIYKIVHE